MPKLKFYTFQRPSLPTMTKPAFASKTAISELKRRMRSDQRQLRRLRFRRLIGLPLPPVDSSSDEEPVLSATAGSGSGSGSDFKSINGRPATPTAHRRRLPGYATLATRVPAPIGPDTSAASDASDPYAADAISATAAYRADALAASAACSGKTFLHGIEVIAVCSCCEDDSAPSSVTLGDKDTSDDEEEFDSGDGLQLAQEFDWVVSGSD